MNTAFSILVVALVTAHVCGGEGTDRTQRFIDIINRCVDLIPNCSSFGQSSCFGQYEDWARKHCPKYCGFCTAVGTKRFLENSSPYWGPWSPYSACSPSCTGGSKTRTRHCYQKGYEVSTSQCNGVVSMQFHTCTQDDCTPTTTPKCVDALSTCSSYSKTTCNGYASWAIQNCAKYCGYCTDPTSAPTHGVWSHWTGFSACSVSCGSGHMYRTRACHGSTPCVGVSKSSQSCHHSCPVTTVQAPVDGHWGPWTGYSHCSHSCGTGSQTKHRSCNNPSPSNGGRSCTGYSSTMIACHLHACVVTTVPAPVDGHWGPWTAYSHCSHSCGTGSHTRHRSCNNPSPSNGGRPCTGSSYTMATCHLHACVVTTVQASVDGHWGSWTGYSHCSHSCGTGSQTRHRSCNNPSPSNGGRPCIGSSYTMATCHLHACVVNGGWGSWAAWSSCTTSCDLGTIARHRACNHPVPSNGGTQCSGNTTEAHECSKGPCSVWSHWFEGDCSVSCGNGTIERLRHCSTGRDSDCPGIAYQMVPCSNVQCV